MGHVIWVAGIDGCSSGWVAVLKQVGAREARCLRLESLSDIVTLDVTPSIIAIDMPMGFLGAAEAGGRACDRALRATLGARKSSVFSPPVRSALACTTYPAALAANRASSPERIGISKQSFHLFPKMREADAFARASRVWRNRLHEAHPEAAFAALAGAPLALPKRTLAGKQSRARLLAKHFSAPALRAALAQRGKGVAEDDIWDAFAISLTAERIATGQARPFPERAKKDALGIPMVVWL